MENMFHKSSDGSILMMYYVPTNSTKEVFELLSGNMYNKDDIIQYTKSEESILENPLAIVNRELNLNGEYDYKFGSNTAYWHSDVNSGFQFDYINDKSELDSMIRIFLDSLHENHENEKLNCFNMECDIIKKDDKESVYTLKLILVTEASHQFYINIKNMMRSELTSKDEFVSEFVLYNTETSEVKMVFSKINYKDFIEQKFNTIENKQTSHGFMCIEIDKLPWIKQIIINKVSNYAEIEIQNEDIYIYILTALPNGILNPQFFSQNIFEYHGTSILGYKEAIMSAFTTKPSNYLPEHYITIVSEPKFKKNNQDENLAIIDIRLKDTDYIDSQIIPTYSIEPSLSFDDILFTKTQSGKYNYIPTKYKNLYEYWDVNNIPLSFQHIMRVLNNLYTPACNVKKRYLPFNTELQNIKLNIKSLQNTSIDYNVDLTDSGFKDFSVDLYFNTLRGYLYTDSEYRILSIQNESGYYYELMLFHIKDNLVHKITSINLMKNFKFEYGFNNITLNKELGALIVLGYDEDNRPKLLIYNMNSVDLESSKHEYYEFVNEITVDIGNLNKLEYNFNKLYYRISPDNSTSFVVLTEKSIRDITHLFRLKYNRTDKLFYLDKINDISPNAELFVVEGIKHLLILNHDNAPIQIYNLTDGTIIHNDDSALPPSAINCSSYKFIKSNGSVFVFYRKEKDYGLFTISNEYFSSKAHRMYPINNDLYFDPEKIQLLPSTRDSHSIRHNVYYEGKDLVSMISLDLIGDSEPQSIKFKLSHMIHISELAYVSPALLVLNKMVEDYASLYLIPISLGNSSYTLQIGWCSFEPVVVEDPIVEINELRFMSNIHQDKVYPNFIDLHHQDRYVIHFGYEASHVEILSQMKKLFMAGDLHIDYDIKKNILTLTIKSGKNSIEYTMIPKISKKVRQTNVLR